MPMQKDAAQRCGSRDGVNTVTAYCNLSAAAIGVQDNARAEEYSRRAIEVAQRDLPPRHPLAAVALNNLAQACRFQSKYLEAESYYRQAIGIWEDALGAQHPDFARGLMNLAAFYHERGRETGAEDLYIAGRRNSGAVAGQAQCGGAGSAQRNGRRVARRAPLHGSGKALAHHAGRHASRLPRSDPRLIRARPTTPD